MGTLHAMEYASMEDRRLALGAHLTSNHYPPIHPVFIETAEWAIDRVVVAVLEEDPEVWDETTTMPNGLVRSVADIIEGLHLDAFVSAAVEAAEDAERQG